MRPGSGLRCPECGHVYSPPADRCSIDGAPLYAPEVMARVGEKFNRYSILGVLGKGGMGVVYRGEHIMLRKPVAIKVLGDHSFTHAGAATQFLREARAASLIRHPNIVDVTDFGEAPDGAPYFVMEFLEGESLDNVLARQVRIPLFETVNIVNQTARALAATHEHGIVHLDLKPANLYLIQREGRRRVVRRTPHGQNFVVEPEGQYTFVKLLDFGVARFKDDELGPGLTSEPGTVFGTPQYMSPEQARGAPVDARSDIYSLGILFYKMLMGVGPFESDSMVEILLRHVSGDLPPPRGADPAVEVDEGTNRAILRCLEMDPGKRFQSMDELCEALRDCFTDCVFLRDAHRLPGTAEAGIVPPPALPHKPAPTAWREARTVQAALRKHGLVEKLARLYRILTRREEPPPDTTGPTEPRL